MTEKNMILYGYLKTTKETVKLTKSRITIGRNKNCQIIINNNTISKEHAVLEFDEDYNCTIKDLNSSNGTYINGQKMTSIPIKLRTGDKIKFGKFDLEYIFESSNSSDDTKTEKEIINEEYDINNNDISNQNDLVNLESNNNNAIKDGKISLVNENELSQPKINHFQNKKNIFYSFSNSNGVMNNNEQNVTNINNNNQNDKIEKIKEIEYDNENDYNLNSDNYNNINNQQNLNDKYEKIEKKVLLLEKEKKELNEIINDKNNKLKQLNTLFDELNEEYSKLNKNHNDLISYTSDIQKKLDLANVEINELKNNDDNNFDELIKQKDNIISILQNEVNFYKNICHKNENIIPNNENDRLNEKLNTISNIFVNENNKLKKKLEMYKTKYERKENNKNKDKINFKEFEIQMNYQIENFNNIISEYNMKLLDSLNKLSEIFENNNKEEAAKYLIDQINEYMLENQKLYSENAKLNTQILELHSLFDNKYKNIEMKKYINESDESIQINRKNNNEINNLMNKLNNMENIVSKLNIINSNNKYEYKYIQLKESFINVLNELKTKDKVIKDLQNKLKDVIQRNNINFDQNQIVDSVSQKLKEKDNIIQNLKNQVNNNIIKDDYRQRIDNIRRERELFN